MEINFKYFDIHYINKQCTLILITQIFDANKILMLKLISLNITLRNAY